MSFSSSWDDPIAQAYFSRLARMDIAFQEKFKRFQKRLPLFFLLRREGGSGFRMAKMLRYYFEDYNHRFLNHGPLALPVSFNVVQAFFEFNTEFSVFDLRQEQEHFLRLEDYFEWYTSDQKIPADPKILIDVLPEGVVYSYDMVGDTGAFTISTEGSRLAIVGVSLVRHEHELSIILLSGENPPYPPDSEVSFIERPNSRPKGKEGLSADESLSIKDRYMEGMTGFVKVLLLTRFNLVSKRHDVRYLNIDTGPGFMVLTDDPKIFDPSTVGQEEQTEIIQNSIPIIDRYSQLFSALSSLIYLPVMFVAENNRVVEPTFTTSLGITTQKPNVRKAVKEFGKKALILSRSVRCLTSANKENLVSVGRRIIEPPNFTFETTGFWKPLGPNEIGEDKSGNQIFGQTWVERMDTYSVKNADSFVISTQTKASVGNDPGMVYIMRSPSHGNDLYKIGITRRAIEQRAQELSSSTGSPLPFEVLASWEVDDCGVIEKEVHSRLKQYRVSKRREFFLTSLANIVHTVEQSIADENR